MKVSIVIQYYNRRYQLLNTIKSISESNSYQDIEIIIVDDASDDIHKIDDLPSYYPDLNFSIFSFTKQEKWWGCPVIPINKGIAMASGDVIILLCGECMFVGDIITDVLRRIKTNDYLVYATLSLTPEATQQLNFMSYDDIINNQFESINLPGHTGGWYQHSLHRNTCFNFCTAITKEDLDDLGGFDERFAYGISHGDDNFLDRVKLKGMNIISIDSPMTYHQYHDRMLFPLQTNNPVDGNLLEITRTESNYKVSNSFK